MNAKQGFHWKTIEQKPDHWEKLHKLIQTVNQKEEIMICPWKNTSVVLSHFFKKFSETRDFFPKELWGMKPKTTLSKGGHSKKGPSLKHEIRNRVEDERILKDLTHIQFRENLQPIQLQFMMPITFILMIIVWNVKVFSIPKMDIVCLDAIISLNRILQYEKESMERECLEFFQACQLFQVKMNRKINESMYELLFRNPKLLIESTADQRKQSIQLYPEQLTLIDSVEKAITTNRPLLIGNQMPTGTGKTFLAVPLAQRLSRLRRNKKTVLFACSNELVTEDIARTALLGDDLHLWIAKLIRDENTGSLHILLRPHKRCFPDRWKQVYKINTQDKTGSMMAQWNFYREKIGKIPDILVADLEACLWLLRDAGQIQHPFVAYIDEFISDSMSNQLMGQICRFLPRQSILLSAILPTFRSLEPILADFRQRHDPNNVFSDIFVRVNTLNIPITCVIVDSNGKLRFPHHQVQTVEDLQALVDEIKINPRLRRCYAAKYVYFWTKSVQSLLEPENLDFQSVFPNIGMIRNANIIEYVIRILEMWLSHFEEWKDRIQCYAPSLMEAPNGNQMFSEQAYVYDGKTLWVANEIAQKVDRASQELFQNQVDLDLLIKDYESKERYRLSRIQQLENLRIDRSTMKKGASVEFSKMEKERQLSEIESQPNSIVLPSSFVINSREHFQRFHPNSRYHLTHRTSNVLPSPFYQAFDSQSNLNMMAGIGLYNKSDLTSYQRNLVMSIYSNLVFLCSNQDIVFGTNLPDLVNVWISRDFAETQSISTLYQLMGRVGRIGKSYHANIILEDEKTVQKILSLDGNVDFTEIQTLIQSFI